MATWTRQSSVVYSGLIRYICSSGTKIYYVRANGFNYGGFNPGGDVYEFDPATNLHVKILDQGNMGWSNIGGIAWFDGNLYIAEWSNGDSIFGPNHVGNVHVWDGSVDSATLIHNSFNLDYSVYKSSGYFRLFSDTNGLYTALVANDSTGEGYRLNYYQTEFYNGSSWAAGGFGTTPVEGSTRCVYQSANPIGVFEVLNKDSDGTAWVGKFSGASMAAYQGSPAAFGGLLASNPGGTLHFGTITDNTYYLNAIMSSATQIDTNISCIMQVNMPYLCGVDGSVASGSDLYTFGESGPDWNLLENIDENVYNPAFSVDETCIIRMNDAEVYIIGPNISTGRLEVWQRSEPIPFPSAGGRLWIYRTDDGGESWTSKGVTT